MPEMTSEDIVVPTPGEAPQDQPGSFRRGARIHNAGAAGGAWRLTEGAVRFDTIDDQGRTEFAGLATVGDIIGGEALIYGRYSFRATALTACRLAEWPGAAADDSGSLAHALARAEERGARTLALRGGQAAERVRRLIGMLLPIARGTVVTAELPPLKDMADITSLTIETVSRSLSAMQRDGVLRPVQQRRGNGSKVCSIDATALPLFAAS